MSTLPLFHSKVRKPQLLESPAPPKFLDYTNKVHVEASSAHVSHSIGNLTDSDPETYWQSDGNGPHNLVITIARQIAVESIAISVCCIKDHTFVPLGIDVYAGSGNCDTTLVHKDVIIPRRTGVHKVYTNESIGCKYGMFILVINKNYDGGRDSRIRGLNIQALRDVDDETASDMLRASR